MWLLFARVPCSTDRPSLACSAMWPKRWFELLDLPDARRMCCGPGRHGRNIATGSCFVKFMYAWKKSRAGKGLENSVETKGSCVFGQWYFPFFCQNCLFCLHTPSVEYLLVPIGLYVHLHMILTQLHNAFPKIPVPLLPNLSSCSWHSSTG